MVVAAQSAKDEPALETRVKLQRQALRGKDTDAQIEKGDSFELFGILQAAISAQKSTPGKADLSEEQITCLLDRLARMADASSEADLRKFTMDGFPAAAADFEGLFATVNTGMTA